MPEPPLHPGADRAPLFPLPSLAPDEQAGAAPTAPGPGPSIAGTGPLSTPLPEGIIGRTTPQAAGPAGDEPRWVEGLGYVYSRPPTNDARWVDGLGYVVDRQPPTGQ